MSWHGWADELRQAPQQAVADLLRGAADISPFERATPHEFLLAILPRDSRILSRALLGEPHSTTAARVGWNGSARSHSRPIETPSTIIGRYWPLTRPTTNYSSSGTHS
jgi:hypothetical protein